MRINQYLAASSGLSRRAADAAIAAGRVMLNGQPATVGDQVDADGRVQLDGQVVRPPQTHTYVLLHKPTGYVSSRRRQGSDPTLYELLPTDLHHLQIAGRLDRDSSGLILLSNDGDFIQAITHPSHGKTKLYELTLSSPLTTAARGQLEAGVELEDGFSRVTVEHIQGRHVTVSLGEGRNRQLRRTFAALGHPVETLHRTRMGAYALGQLPAGGWTHITVSPS